MPKIKYLIYHKFTYLEYNDFSFISIENFNNFTFISQQGYRQKALKFFLFIFLFYSV